MKTKCDFCITTLSLMKLSALLPKFRYRHQTPVAHWLKNGLLPFSECFCVANSFYILTTSPFCLCVFAGVCNHKLHV